MSESPFKKVAEQLAEDWFRIPHLRATDLAERAIELAVRATTGDHNVDYWRKVEIAARILELMKEGK